MNLLREPEPRLNDFGKMIQAPAPIVGIVAGIAIFAMIVIQYFALQ